VSIATTTSRHLSEKNPQAAPQVYWEARARRFARNGAGLGAVCSYGMPWFYNRYIHLIQDRALDAWLLKMRGSRVLDIGCGIGRWSRKLAHSGAMVTGIDLSDTMIAEARRRAEIDAIGSRCRFLVADVTDFALGERFDFVLGVTVLQHVKESSRLDAALQHVARHLEPQGRIVLMEVAPARRTGRCDSDVFVAREETQYRSAFERAGLRLLETQGVDPAPFKRWLLPWYRHLPQLPASAALAMVTAASLPVDILFARQFQAASWHRIFVLKNERGCA